MKNFIKLSFSDEIFNKYLIDVDLIEYVADNPGTESGSQVYLKGKSDPLKVDESADSVLRSILKLTPEQTPPVVLRCSLFGRK